MLLLLLRHGIARLLKEEEQEAFSSVATGLIAVAQEMLHAANDNSNRNPPGCVAIVLFLLWSGPCSCSWPRCCEGPCCFSADLQIQQHEQENGLRPCFVVLRVHRANHRLEGARGLQTDVQQQQARA